MSGLWNWNLGRRGLRVERQVALTVYYKGEPAGNYIADLVVEGALVVELKCVGAITHEHVAQCLNYLRASDLNVGLVINFERSRVEWRRVVCDFRAVNGNGVAQREFV